MLKTLYLWFYGCFEEKEEKWGLKRFWRSFAESQNNLWWMRNIEIADELLYYCFQIAFFQKNAKLSNKVIKLRMKLQKNRWTECIPQNTFTAFSQDKQIVKVLKHKKDLNLNIEKPLPVFVIRGLKNAIIKEAVRNVNLKLKENKKNLISNKSNHFQNEMQPIRSRGWL